MPKDEFIQHSVLIVSSSEQFDAIVKRSLPKKSFPSVESRKSASLARRSFLERYYDLVIINAPLPDENGLEISLDIIDTSNASVLLVVSKESYDDITDRVTDYGVLVLAKPFHWRQIDKAIRFLTAIQNKRHQLEYKMRDLQDKMEDLRTVAKAKCMLIEKKHMTEDQAHRFIGKTAMDHGISRKRAAIRIMDDL
ncbi:MAG: ANTAR domain-containing protein [Eubacterium sp.]|nr:ANTAR domain-containing protein [Eubacterium sp.]